MTTTIKVRSHNYPALVQVLDRAIESDAKDAEGYVTAYQKVITPDDGEQEFYCTTTRLIRVTDLEYDDPRVTALRPVS